jgi:hypothetical protein
VLVDCAGGGRVCLGAAVESGGRRREGEKKMRCVGMLLIFLSV